MATRNAEAGGGVLSIGHDNIYFIPADKVREQSLYGLPPRFSDDVTDKQDLHERISTDSILPVTGAPPII